MAEWSRHRAGDRLIASLNPTPARQRLCPCGVALDAVPNLMVEYINKGIFLDTICLTDPSQALGCRTRRQQPGGHWITQANLWGDIHVHRERTARPGMAYCRTSPPAARRGPDTTCAARQIRVKLSDPGKNAHFLQIVWSFGTIPKSPIFWNGFSIQNSKIPNFRFGISFQILQSRFLILRGRRQITIGATEKHF